LQLHTAELGGLMVRDHQVRKRICAERKEHDNDQHDDEHDAPAANGIH
jgi:hypothetical protein